MQTIAMLLLILATSAAAVYTHYRLPYHTSTAKRRWFLHALLICIGSAFGWTNMQQYPVTGLLGIFIFLSSFGAVHVPAAAILFIKRQQKEN